MVHNEYAKTIQGFRALAHACARVSGFIHGDTDKLLNAQRSKAKYPLLVLDFPTAISIRQKNENRDGATVRGSFAILSNAPADDFRRQNDVMLETYEVCRMLINAALRGYPDVNSNTALPFEHGIVEFNDLVPVVKYTSDNLFGWAAEFKIQLNSCPAEIWQDNFAGCPENDDAYFNWASEAAVIDDNPGTLITCNYVLPDGGEFVSWYWRNITTNTWTASEEEILEIENPNAAIVVLLEWQDADGCTHWQVASVPVNVGRDIYGISYPTTHSGTLELNEDIWLL